MRILLPLLSAALLSPLAFAGGNGWDWVEEFQSRHWRTASLQWAQDIHPQHPSFSDLQEHFYPPAHEMWCHHTEEPTQTDVEIHKDLLDEWMHDFLDIPLEEPLPTGLPPYPKEC